MSMRSRAISAAAVCLLIVSLMNASFAQAPVRDPNNVTPMTATPVTPSAPIEIGQRVFYAGHSFHMFIAGGRDGSEGPIAKLAREAGFDTHATVGRDMIGGSTPMQHWNQGTEETNPIKVALRAGDVDVLTLAGNARIPEEGIDKFADLAIEHNPDVRVLVQMSWGTFDGLGREMNPADRDLTTFEDLARMRSWVEPYQARMRGQIESINERHGKTFAYIVPVHSAVLAFRKEVLAGRVPGITKQTELFRDGLGHVTQPLQDVVAYTWFAAIYRKSPVGMTALDTEGTPESKEAHRVMQQVAWESVLEEPYSGVVLPQRTITPAANAGATN